jgi:VWFA-related protein
MIAGARSHPGLAAIVFALFFGALAPAQDAQPSPDRPLNLKVDVDRVLVPVVVRDRQGRAVGDLKQEDFQVLDNGHPRTISAFTIQQRRAPQAVPATSPHGGAQPPAPASASQPSRFILFLFDDLHLDFEDLAHSQKAAGAMLDSALTPSDLAAVVSTSGVTNSGFSPDRARLRSAIASLRPRNLYRPEGAGGMTDVVSPQTLPNRPAGGTPAISPAQALAEQDLRVTFAAIAEFVRSMAALPGQRTLILVSPGFPIPNGDMEARDEESRVFDLAARSNVTIGALDARGVVAAGPSQSPAQEDVMSELANATGGTFLHTSNDLAAEFERLTEAPEVVYLIELSLDNIKPDGTLHRLKVKVDRPGLDIQARRGYYLPKPQKNQK